MAYDGASYQVADFIPFTAEVYFRLIERVSEAYWPLHLLALTVALVALGLAITGRNRIAVAMLSIAWAWAGVTFLIQRYGQLNWAGEYFGWAFLVQAGLMLVFAITSRRIQVSSRFSTFPQIAGLVICVFGLVIYPLIAVIAGLGWSRAEVFGIHPDPTAVVTVGIALLALRGGWLWLVGIIPVLWCLVAALTLQVLEAPWAISLFAVTGVAIVGLVWKSLSPPTTDSIFREA